MDSLALAIKTTFSTEPCTPSFHACNWLKVVAQQHWNTLELRHEICEYSSSRGIVVFAMLYVIHSLRWIWMGCFITGIGTIVPQIIRRSYSSWFALCSRVSSTMRLVATWGYSSRTNSITRVMDRRYWMEQALTRKLWDVSCITCPSTCCSTSPTPQLPSESDMVLAASRRIRERLSSYDIINEWQWTT